MAKKDTISEIIKEVQNKQREFKKLKNKELDKLVKDIEHDIRNQSNIKKFKEKLKDQKIEDNQKLQDDYDELIKEMQKKAPGLKDPPPGNKKPPSNKNNDKGGGTATATKTKVSKIFI